MQTVELLDVPPVRISDIFGRPEVDTGIIRLKATVRNDTGAVARGSLTMFVASATEGNTIGTASRFEDGYFRLNGQRIFLRSAHTGNHYPIGLQLPHDPELLRRDLYYARTMGFNMVRFIAGVAYPSQLDFCDELGLLVYEESYAGWCLEDSPKMAERFDRSTAEMILRDRNHPCIVIWGLLNETPDGPVFRHAVESLPLVRKLDDTRMVLLNSGRWDNKWSIGSICNPGSTVWEHLLGTEEKDAPDGRGFSVPGYVEGAGDAHYYPPIPLSAESIRFFRTMGEKTKHVFLSEHVRSSPTPGANNPLTPFIKGEAGLTGNGSEVDAIRVTRLFEQAGAPENLEDYQQYRSEAEKYLADWERFGLDTVFASPGDLLLQSQRVQAEQRLVGLNAIRSNPNLCGYSLTGLCDQGMTAEGLWTTFRELKPGMVDAIRDGWAPLRWCTFVEPVHGYSGQPFNLEVVLANEYVLRPGEYPVRLKVFTSFTDAPSVSGCPRENGNGERDPETFGLRFASLTNDFVLWVGPGGTVLNRSIVLNVPNPQERPEPPMVLPVFSETIKIDGPAGKYEIVAYFERGAAPVGGRSHLFVSDPGSLPSVDAEVTIWGDEEPLEAWLKDHGIRVRQFTSAPQTAREVIFVLILQELSEWV